MWEIYGAGPASRGEPGHPGSRRRSGFGFDAIQADRHTPVPVCSAYGPDRTARPQVSDLNYQGFTMPSSRSRASALGSIAICRRGLFHTMVMIRAAALHDTLADHRMSNLDGIN
jgi:hypothetical protein